MHGTVTYVKDRSTFIVGYLRAVIKATPYLLDLRGARALCGRLTDACKKFKDHLGKLLRLMVGKGFSS